MSNAELLVECKNGLGIQTDSTSFDGVLTQKLLMVKSYMRGAGVTDEAMEDDLAAGIIVMGVADLWNTAAGEIKFSPAFHTLLIQLAIGGNVLTVSSDPADSAIDVAVDIQPELTFNKRITDDYEVSIVNYSTQIGVSITVSLDITGKVLTIEPANDLDAATKYAIVIDSATARSGQTLGYTVLSFTTA